MSSPDQADRLLTIEGTVQGIGFRPFVARLAGELQVRGWVRNSPRGVTLRLAADEPALTRFVERLRAELPPAGEIAQLLQTPAPSEPSVPPLPRHGFVILDSAEDDAPLAAVTPDLALCPACRAELFDPGNRRAAYPFANCTACGPRYTILRALPYDRPHTTMAGFTMCADCAREYADPHDRRFHAQPNACPVCGPQVELQNAVGEPLAARAAAIEQAAHALCAGGIVAVKGLGGFHLLVDATNDSAVAELRRRKHREEKPLAVMFASLEQLRSFAQVSEAEERLLTSAAAPIVLVRRRASDRGAARETETPPNSSADSPMALALAAAIAPGNPWIGAFLAYTPLHALLLAAVGRPVVATSGNLAEEPLCIDNAEARERLGRIADAFLVHDRPIARAVDDSVLRPADGGPVLLRRARGFAPAPFPLPDSTPRAPALLCVGGHLKNTIAITAGRNVVLSPHVGDLDSPLTLAAFRHTIELLRALHELRFERVVCDAHPDYASTRAAESLGLPVTRVQHHLAHVLACLLEHGGGPERVLGVAWDGTGYGADGTVWGGEFIVVDRRAGTAKRIAHLRPFRLPGGDAAVREPRRSAFALLHELFAGEPQRLADIGSLLEFPESEARLLETLLTRGVHAPVSTSAGRLFDGVSALLGLRQRASFEGQAAMELEAAAAHASADPGLWSLPVCADTAHGRLELDWRPTLAALLAERAHTPTAVLAARFHATLAAAIGEVAEHVGIETVALSGGCFQNVRLLELTSTTLARDGFSVLRHQDLPPNDGGLAAGQALGALWDITSVD